MARTKKNEVKVEAVNLVRKHSFSERSLRSHYSHRVSGLTVRAWVGKPDILIRDARGVEANIPDDEIDGLITALISLKKKKEKKESATA